MCYKYVNLLTFIVQLVYLVSIHPNSVTPTWHNTNMARTYNAVKFKVIHETKFTGIIRGHYVYKTIWNTVIGEVLYVKPYNLKEALEHGK